jgi:hypothetical protein
MNTHCPQCGEEYDEPQPKNFICGNCAFKNVLSVLGVQIVENPPANSEQEDEEPASRKLTRRELAILALNEAIGQMKKIGEALGWSDPIDEGYIQALHGLRGIKISLKKSPRK